LHLSGAGAKDARSGIVSGSGSRMGGVSCLHPAPAAAGRACESMQESTMGVGVGPTVWGHGRDTWWNARILGIAIGWSARAATWHDCGGWPEPRAWVAKRTAIAAPHPPLRRAYGGGDSACAAMCSHVPGPRDAELALALLARSVKYSCFGTWILLEDDCCISAASPAVWAVARMRFVRAKVFIKS
jgi:hypothetical protein